MQHLFRSTAAIIMVSAAFISCDSRSFDCERGNRDVVTETRNITAFKAISVSSSFHVEITEGEELSVQVEAEDNIIDQVVTEVQDATLIIKKSARSCFSERRTINIFITTPELEAISLSGSGEVQVNNLTTDYLNLLLTGSGDLDVAATADELEAEITGSGSITLFGQGNESNLEVTGSGEFNGFNFEHNRCFVKVTGSGSAELFVNDILDAEITGSGDVIYKGNPSVRSEVTGSGDVRRL